MPLPKQNNKHFDFGLLDLLVSTLNLSFAAHLELHLLLSCEELLVEGGVHIWALLLLLSSYCGYVQSAGGRNWNRAFC